jgi:hypothetical protein
MAFTIDPQPASEAMEDEEENRQPFTQLCRCGFVTETCKKDSHAPARSLPAQTTSAITQKNSCFFQLFLLHIICHSLHKECSALP